MNTPGDQRLLFHITFQSLTLVDCPAHLQNKQCYLRYIRGSNDLKIRKAAINQDGVATFNEKIEMKTSLEYDEQRACFKQKLSNLNAVLVNGDQRENIGICTVDLASFHKIGTHTKRLLLNNIITGVSSKSYISLQVETSQSQKDAARSSMMNGSAPSDRSIITMPPNNYTTKQLAQYEQEIKELQSQNKAQAKQNNELMQQLMKSDLYKKASTPKGLVKDTDLFQFKSKNKQENYEQIQGISQREVKQLLNMDGEIEKLFDQQQKMQNSNETKLQQEINELNDKPILRDYLFRQVSDQLLQKDIDEIKKYMEAECKFEK